MINNNNNNDNNNYNNDSDNNVIMMMIIILYNNDNNNRNNNNNNNNYMILISNNCISWIVSQIDASKKEVNQLDTGLTVLPCPITTPMNLTFKFQIKACVSKMNAVARARSTFQMLTLLQKYLHHQSLYSKTWDSKCLALIAQ